MWRHLQRLRELPVVSKSLGALQGTHGFVQKFFEGQAPSQYRLKGNKYSHHYGAPKRQSDGPNLAPYLAGAVLTGMAVFFVVLPISFNRSYAASKQKYEAFARENGELLDRQFDRPRLSQEARPCPPGASSRVRIADEKGLRRLETFVFRKSRCSKCCKAEQSRAKQDLLQ